MDVPCRHGMDNGVMDDGAVDDGARPFNGR
jgi:hypothetical protein